MSTDPVPKPSALLGKRHGQVLLLFFGLFTAYIQRSNLSVGLVAMTDPANEPEYPTLDYNIADKGVISSMFFYGYLVSGIPAGILANKYGTVKLLVLVCGFLCGLSTIAVPILAVHVGFAAVCASRVVQGFGQGFILSCIHAHMSKWVTAEERETFACVWTGGTIGTVSMLGVSGIILKLLGWPSLFYVSGALSIIWGIICWIFGSDSPGEHPTISPEERDYIEQYTLASSNGTKAPMKIAWWSILTSGPMWAILIAHFCDNWSFFNMLSLMPTYLKGVYNLGTTEVGIVSAVPYISMFFCGLIFPWIAGRMKNCVGTKFIRKFWNSVAFFGEAAFLFVLGTTELEVNGAIAILTTVTSINSATTIGYLSNHLDLSPDLAGILMGITNTFANISSIIAPTWTGYKVTDEHNIYQWQSVYFITAIICVAGNSIFLLLGSTSVQPWGYPQNNKEKPEMCDA